MNGWNSRDCITHDVLQKGGSIAAQESLDDALGEAMSVPDDPGLDDADGYQLSARKVHSLGGGAVEGRNKSHVINFACSPMSCGGGQA